MTMKSKTSIRKDEKGFTLIEVLVALLCVSLITLLLTQCIRIIKQMSIYQYHSEDRIAVHQLRLLLALAYDFKITNGILYFALSNEEYRLEYHEQRFVRRNGYEIFLQDITMAQIKKKGRCYHLTWKRKNIQKEALLVCE